MHDRTRGVRRTVPDDLAHTLRAQDRVVLHHREGLHVSARSAQPTRRPQNHAPRQDAHYLEKSLLPRQTPGLQRTWRTTPAGSYRQEAARSNRAPPIPRHPALSPAAAARSSGMGCPLWHTGDARPLRAARTASSAGVGRTDAHLTGSSIGWRTAVGVGVGDRLGWQTRLTQRACTPSYRQGMTRSEAQQRCSELNAAAAGDPGARWMAREAPPGQWSPVRVRVPGMRPTGPLTTTRESRQPDGTDPRPITDPLLGTGGVG
jgi:hypothetical protein